MRYVVLGCGAIGGTVAAGLVRDGHDVLVSDADPAVVAAVNENGLRIEGPIEDFTVRVPAVLPADLPERLDCPVLVACKSQHTAAAAASLAGRLHGDGFVVSLQNGLNAEQLAAVVGPDRVVESFVNTGADVIAPGVVLRGSREPLLIGEIDGTVSDRVKALVADIADAEVTEHVIGHLWGKEAYGAMLAAIAVSDLSIADGFEDPAYAPLLVAVAREVLDQAPVTPMGFDGFDPDDLEGSLAGLPQRVGTPSTAMMSLTPTGRPASGPSAARRGAPITAATALTGRPSRSRRSYAASRSRLDRSQVRLPCSISVISSTTRRSMGPFRPPMCAGTSVGRCRTIRSR